MSKDISHERLRIYGYADGGWLRIEQPATLEYLPTISGYPNHFVTAKDGRTYEVAAGWRSITTVPQKPESDIDALMRRDPNVEWKGFKPEGSAEDRVHA